MGRLGSLGSGTLPLSTVPTSASRLVCPLFMVVTILELVRGYEPLVNIHNVIVQGMTHDNGLPKLIDRFAQAFERATLDSVHRKTENNNAREFFDLHLTFNEHSYAPFIMYTDGNGEQGLRPRTTCNHIQCGCIPLVGEQLEEFFARVGMNSYESILLVDSENVWAELNPLVPVWSTVIRRALPPFTVERLGVTFMFDWANSRWSNGSPTVTGDQWTVRTTVTGLGSPVVGEFVYKEARANPQGVTLLEFSAPCAHGRFCFSCKRFSKRVANVVESGELHWAVRGHLLQVNELVFEREILFCSEKFFEPKIDKGLVAAWEDDLDAAVLVCRTDPAHAPSYAPKVSG